MARGSVHDVAYEAELRLNATSDRRCERAMVDAHLELALERLALDVDGEQQDVTAGVDEVGGLVHHQLTSREHPSVGALAQVKMTTEN